MKTLNPLCMCVLQWCPREQEGEEGEGIHQEVQDTVTGVGEGEEGRRRGGELAAGGGRWRGGRRPTPFANDDVLK